MKASNNDQISSLITSLEKAEQDLSIANESLAKRNIDYNLLSNRFKQSHSQIEQNKIDLGVINEKNQNILDLEEQIKNLNGQIVAKDLNFQIETQNLRREILESETKLKSE